ncbi:glycosyltransferase family 4 protein [Iodobacter sp. CM08]|uniref:glycosyltransferase family 4 protein n=1 Tax=Iodobacter sp. CM08 TaxID=3085902 RepID=UPI002980B259|nr:glycosyltransferase family 4 protein [Iodobacter sp. CM08]MDW5416965.1 glycosyltransferase family 4 protein [Iodobacter sp. CM08]
MNIMLAANITPFLHGGADYHIQGTADALRNAGCKVEILRLPFTFQPEQSILDLMQWCNKLNLNHPNGYRVDRLISLQFPCYGIEHNHHTAWIMHQHRAVYELYSPQNSSPALAQLKDAIIEYDHYALSHCTQRFANSKRVAARLYQYNDLKAQPLYHPPPAYQAFHHAQDLGYIFCPSRIETLKRQDLLIKALALAPKSLPIVIAGTGGQADNLMRLCEQLNLTARVKMLGAISEAEKIAYYAHATAVFFAPFDEDYGYITHEAMLSGKPVISCSDSGGPLEFIEHLNTGWIVEPTPEAIATVLEWISQHRNKVEQMGLAAQQAWPSFKISWNNVLSQLLEN